MGSEALRSRLSRDLDERCSTEAGGRDGIGIADCRLA